MADIDFGRFHTTPATLWRPRTEGFAPRYRIPDEVHDDLRRIERADHDLARFRLDRVAARRLLEDARTRNVFGTASIEGNPLTMDEVESLLARGPSPENLERPDEREIIRQADFLDHLDDHPPPRTPDDVRGIHRFLFDGVLPDAGRFKDRPNFIGRTKAFEVTYVPTPPERVETELQWALDWLREAPEHPLVKAIVFFHELQGIHPFRDGNGRVGRTVNTLLLHHGGYAGIRYAHLDFAFNADPGPYYEHLAVVERNGYDYTPWIRYMARILRTTFEDAVARFLFEAGLPSGLNDRQARLAVWLARMDKERPGRRLALNDIHAAHPHIPERTLRRDLGVLVAARVLASEGRLKGTRYHVAHAVVAEARANPA